MSAYKRTYIAGPMRGIDFWNHPAFFAAEEYLLDLGYNKNDIFNPARHDTDQGIEAPANGGAEGFDLRAALAADLAWISANAEVILLLPGWEKSAGVAAELALAKALHLGAVLFDPEDADESLVYEDANSIQQKPLLPVSVVTGHGVEQKQMTPDEIAQWTTDAGLDEIPLQQHGLDGRHKHRNLDDAFGCAVCQKQVLSENKITGEVRVVDPVTGGEKGSKPERFDLIPVGALREIARVYGFGAAKYADNNWRKGYAWHLSYAANQRHLTSFWDGEDLDPESQLPHLAHAAWQSITLLQFYLDGLGTDDRFKR